MNIRPTWDEYFINIMNAVATRSTCDRGRSGCVITKNNTILSTGYVGSPPGMPHCDEVGHQMKNVIHVDEGGRTTSHCVRTTHAEANAIYQAAKNGVTIEGATLYCRMTPCRVCAQAIISCGITGVICERRYHAGAESIEMFCEAGISIVHLFDEEQQYEGV